jgi:hypothetical protein
MLAPFSLRRVCGFAPPASMMIAFVSDIAPLSLPFGRVPA